MLGAALLPGAGCKPTGGASQAGATAPPVPVQVAVAQQLDVPRGIEAVGTVQALRTVAVKSQVDGIIAQIHFKEGDEVKAGDRLITLDRRPLENSLRIARADLANARAESLKADNDRERYQRLDQQDAISKEQFAQLNTKAETTRALVQAKEAAVANAELLFGYTEIRAPIAGRTGQHLLHEGALVKANDNSFPLVTLNQLSPIAVTYAIPERMLDDIRTAVAAQRAVVTVSDRSGGRRRSDGRLDFINNTVDPATGTILLKAVFDNGDHSLWPGEFMQVWTQFALDRGAIVVPSTAVQTSQSGSNIFIVKPDRIVEFRSVKITRTDGERTLVAEGVRAGETVVTDGQLRLLPGSKVEFKTIVGTAVVPVVEARGEKRP